MTAGLAYLLFAGACVGIRLRGGTIDRAAISLFGMGSVPLRAADAENALLGLSAHDIDAVAVGHDAVRGLDPPADLHASSELRRRIGGHVVSRALAHALEEAAVA